jgi:hypothetical protein
VHIRAVWRYSRAVRGLMLISSQYRSKSLSWPWAVMDSSLSPMTSRFSRPSFISRRPSRTS